MPNLGRSARGGEFYDVDYGLDASGMSANAVQEAQVQDPDWGSLLGTVARVGGGVGLGLMSGGPLGALAGGMGAVAGASPYRTRGAGYQYPSLAAVSGGVGLPAVRGQGGGKFVSVGRRGVVGLLRRDGTVRVIRTGGTAHIGKNLPRHRQLVLLRRNMMRHLADARLVASFAGYRLVKGGKGRRVGGGHYRRRRSYSRGRR